MDLQIPVLIEPVAGNGYQAAALGLIAHGATEEEALVKLRETVAQRQAAGAKIVPLNAEQLPPAGAMNHWLQLAGTLDPADPMVQEWLAIMEENRRKADEDPDWP